jgi:hypothetical protein
MQAVRFATVTAETAGDLSKLRRHASDTLTFGIQEEQE